MEKPNIFQKAPFISELDPGTYLWCSCGNAEGGALCDGSHKGSDFKPVPFTITEKKKVALCQCKYTQRPPFCDGTHRLRFDD